MINDDGGREVFAMYKAVSAPDLVALSYQGHEEDAVRVFGYARVSTDRQALGDSLEVQSRQIGAWATLKGWAIAETFVEPGENAYLLPLADRPEGRRLLETVEKGDVIITAKLDRMFRSAADALAVLEVLKAQGIGLHMIDLGGDVCGNGISKMVFTILAAVAEGERERIRERITAVKRHLAAKGIYGGGRVPFGYDLDGDRLVPNPEQQKVLAEMRSMRAGGETYRAIGAAVGIGPKSVLRILKRVDAASTAA